MAQQVLFQKPLRPGPQKVEIEERDQANNVVATYIKSSKDELLESSRIDVIVSAPGSCLISIDIEC
jgi:hypothetical protein